MFTVTAIATGGLSLRENHARAQDAYLATQSWIARGYAHVALMAHDGRWYHGPNEIRQFMEGVQKFNSDA